MTQAGLLFIGLMALLATFGLFVDFRDREGKPDRATQVIIPFIGALLWAVFGLSASDVIVRQNSFASASEPIEPLFWLGVLMALLVGAYGIYELFVATYDAATESGSGGSLL